MAIYRIGCKGPEVLQIQQRLRSLAFYAGPLDGDFGGGTDCAVRLFQKKKRIEIDGKVGPLTWKALFARGTPPQPALLDQPLARRCLALTGTFETGAPVPECFAGLSGDFDGQGISFGSLQWNLGQGSLQPLLAEFAGSHPRQFDEIFGDNASVLLAVLDSDHEDQLAWARSIQDRLRFTLFEPWRGQFKTLGRREEFQKIQVKASQNLLKSARQLCAEFDVGSQRALALMFDIKVQNGSIGALVRAQIRNDFDQIPTTATPAEVEVRRLRIIANRRAEASRPQWVEDVRKRKLTIANGEGTVHGNYFNLEEQYGITLDAA